MFNHLFNMSKLGKKLCLSYLSMALLLVDFHKHVRSRAPKFYSCYVSAKARR